MGFTPDQIKGRLKYLASQTGADPRTLMRLYMMERFMERLSRGKYRDFFIIKGGILVTAMLGVSLRSTMDIDASVRNFPLSMEDAQRMVEEIIALDIGDNVVFEIKQAVGIMDEMEYPGIRFTMNAYLGKLVTPLKIDISTGDVITPRAIAFRYPLLLENREISLFSYNLETLLSEKLQTVLSRGILNTRMRDYYDIHSLWNLYQNSIDAAILQEAYRATCEVRGTAAMAGQEILAAIRTDQQLAKLWQIYVEKYPYAAGIPFSSVVSSVQTLYSMLTNH